MGRHVEHHHGDRIGGLRTAVRGANDGIVSTASLALGVAAAGADQRTFLVAGVSGLIAGAMSMAASFSVGAALPIAVVATVPPQHLLPWVSLASLMFLAGLGAVSARIGGARVWNGIWRVAFLGAVAMAVTAGAGALFGAVA